MAPTTIHVFLTVLLGAIRFEVCSERPNEGEQVEVSVHDHGSFQASRDKNTTKRSSGRHDLDLKKVSLKSDWDSTSTVMLEALNSIGIKPEYHKLLNEVSDGDEEILTDITPKDIEGRKDAHGQVVTIETARALVKQIQDEVWRGKHAMGNSLQKDDSASSSAIETDWQKHDSSSDALVEMDDREGAGNSSFASTETELFCNNWCLICHDRPPGKHQKILIFRDHGFYKKVAIIAAGALFGAMAVVMWPAAAAAAVGITTVAGTILAFGIPCGVLGSMGATAVGSMVDGCSVVQFKYDGEETAIVNYAAMIEFADRVKVDMEMAFRCAALSRPRKKGREIKLFETCFKHPWLCGEDGPMEIKVWKWRPESKCFNFNVQEHKEEQEKIAVQEEEDESNGTPRRRSGWR